MKWAELAEQAKQRADKDYRLLTYLVWFLFASAGAMMAIAVVLVIFG